MLATLKNKITGFMIWNQIRRQNMERGDQLIETLGTILIAVVILYIFRTSLSDLFKSTLEAVSAKVTDLFNTNVSGTGGASDPVNP